MLDTRKDETLAELATECPVSRQLDAEEIVTLITFFDLLARWDEQQNADAKKPSPNSLPKIRP